MIPMKRIAYLYDRPAKEGEAMGAEATLADYEGTKRVELAHLIEGGIRSGDVLLLRDLADLGKGKAAARIRAKLDGLGVTIEVIPPTKPTRRPGRRSKVGFKSIDEWEAACSLWYSPAELPHAIERVGQRAGGKVDRNWINYQCGPRDGSQKAAKRREMLKRLEE